MGQKTTVTYQGKPVAGTAMTFETVHEEWNEYKLESGARVRVRLVPVEIVITKKKNAQGDPLVVVQSSALVQYTAPSKSRRR